MRGIPAIATSVLFLLGLAGAAPCLAQPGVGIETDPSTVEDKQTVRLMVYKKWIGASGDEGKVEIHLSCGTGDQEFEARYIDRNKPDGWTVPEVPPDGVTCTVREIERDTFVADVEDCLDLLVLPGDEPECTIVNTKVVKRIDMLNRYGLVLMVAVMLGAGLAGVRRLGLKS